MALRLNKDEQDRLDVLLSGRGFRAGKGIYKRNVGHLTITVEQITHVRKLLKSKTKYSDIMLKTGLSEYMIRNVKKGKYDCIIDGD